MAKNKRKSTGTQRGARAKATPRRSASLLWVVVGIMAVVLIGTIVFVTVSRPSAQVVDAAPLDPPSLGSVAAPVTIVEYGDFGCTSCRAWHRSGVLEQIMAKYGDQVRFVWRDFPVITAQSPKAAEAARCAYDQERFWEYHDLLFDRAPALSVRNLKAYAGELGLDTARFNACLDSGTHAKSVSQDRRDAAQRGLRGTPSFLVNDRVLVGGPSADYLASLIDPWLQ